MWKTSNIVRPRLYEAKLVTRLPKPPWASQLLTLFLIYQGESFASEVPKVGSAGKVTRTFLMVVSPSVARATFFC